MDEHNQNILINVLLEPINSATILIYLQSDAKHYSQLKGKRLQEIQTVNYFESYKRRIIIIVK